MHPSSYENMLACCERYLVGTFVDEREHITIVDMGAADVNGGYRSLFLHDKLTYLGIDLQPGPGVDLVLSDPYRIPLPDGSTDVVISGQALEHVEFFWAFFAEMVRVLRPDGFLFLIAPSAGPIHRFPVDCYRFYPDAYRALAKYVGCDLVDLWHDDRGPWNDLVGVFRQKGAALRQRAAISTAPSTWRPGPDMSVKTSGFTAPPDAEVMAGSVSYLDMLRQIHTDLAPALYLEIGVRHGASLGLASCRAVGVDPAPALSAALPNHAHLCTETSDSFFSRDSSALLGAPIDLVFIDGMHLFEFALRDFMNAERHASPSSVIIVDDIFPNHPIQAERERRSRVWTGDVWKMVPCLREHRKDLILILLDTHPTGLLVIAGLNPEDRQLRSQYNPIVRKYAMDPNFPVPAEVLSRTGATSPQEPRLRDFFALLRQAKQQGAAPGQRLRASLAATGL